MKYRKHRGGLDESMATLVEIGDGFNDFCNHLRSEQVQGTTYLPEIYRNDQLRFKSQGPDARIAWDDSVLVMIEGSGVLGMLDRIPENTPAEQIDPPASPTLSALTELASKHEFQANEHQLDTQTKHYLPVDHSNMVDEINVAHVAALAGVPHGLVTLTTGASSTRADIPFTHQPAIDEFRSEGAARPVEPAALPNENHAAVSGTEWFLKLRDLVAKEETEEALLYIDQLTTNIARAEPVVSQENNQGAAAFAELERWVEDFGHPDFEQWFKELPPHIADQWKQADYGKVVLPDAEHMTEAMIDATRGLHLYYIEGGSGVRCEHMRKHLDRYAPWAKRHFPQWFREDNDHLTKAGRSIVAHALTIGAYFDPDAKETYFKEVRESRSGRIWDNPFHQNIRLTFKPVVMGEEFDGGGFTLTRRFSECHQVGDNKYLLQLNRTDFPKEHRKKFKKTGNAVIMNLANEGREVQFEAVMIDTVHPSSTFNVTPQMVSRH